MVPPDRSRRRFLGACVTAVVVAFARPPAAGAASPRRRLQHPTPRPGITGAKVLGAAALADSPKLVPLFDAVRDAAAIVDGIRCHCGCADAPGNYSLLSCYEGTGMAKVCPVCQGEARLATRMHREGRSLDEIRLAIDAQFG